MNVFRAVSDGIMMAIAFNALTAVVDIINPRLFFDSYPRSIQEAAPQPMTRHEKRFNSIMSVIIVGGLLLYGALSAWNAGVESWGALLATGYINWFLVNLGDLVFLDIILFQKFPERVAIPGTEGHPDYELRNWMRVLGEREHLLLVPFVLAPLCALAQAGLVRLIIKLCML